MHLFSMNHVLDRVVIQMDMYNINIVSDLRTVYHDTNSMIFFTSAEMHISTRALLVEFGSVKKLLIEQIFYFKTKSDHCRLS